MPTAKGAAASATASVHGFVQVAPQVDFAYGGAGTERATGVGVPRRVRRLGLPAGRSRGRAAATTGTPLRIPFAKLHADPVLQVGPVPVVVNLDLTCYLQIPAADGRVTVDVELSV
ncbi:hypothetical protein LT493_17880 [Streptomyces tricolor]|nr:hypothetical protein [Streptomyces tricolor]